jgi:hypothetical protein
MVVLFSHYVSGERACSLSIAPFEIAVACPRKLSIGQVGMLQGSVTATINNESDTDELITYSITVEDSEGNSGSKEDFVLVPAGGCRSVDAHAGALAIYKTAAPRFATATATIGNETKSESRTFDVWNWVGGQPKG